LIRALALGVLACVSCIAAAAAESSSSASMTLCASHDLRLVDQVIEACTAIITAGDTDSAAAATAYGYRGVALLRRTRDVQDVEAGRRDLEKAVSAGLDTAIAFVFRAQLHFARQNPDLAIADCDEAIRRDPQLAAAFILRGRAYAIKQNFERAAGDYSEAIRIDPTYAGASAGRAGASSGSAGAGIPRADWGLAAPDVERAPQVDTKSRVAAARLATRATARYQQSDYAGAIADCDEALKLDPRNEQALKIRAFAHTAQGTASSAGGPGATPETVLAYVAHGPAGACGPKCEDWLAVEGTANPQGVRRVIAALDRLGTRKLPVVLDFRGNGDLNSAMSIGKILRERGFDATVGRTRIDDCDDPFQAKCVALKQTGKPVQAALVPNRVCDIVCVLALAGGVRRTVPDATTVVITGMWIPNRVGVEAVAPFREGRYVRSRDLLKLHFTQLGVDPQVADMMEESNDSRRATGLSREDVERLRIVTAR